MKFLSTALLFLSFNISAEIYYSVEKINNGNSTQLLASYLIIEEGASEALSKVYEDYNEGLLSLEEMSIKRDDLKKKGQNDKLVVGVSDTNDLYFGHDLIKLVVIDGISEKKSDYLKLVSEINESEEGELTYNLTINLYESNENYLVLKGRESLGKKQELTQELIEKKRRELDKEVLRKFLVTDAKLRQIITTPVFRF